MCNDKMIVIRCSKEQKESLISALFASEEICPFRYDGPCSVDNCIECMSERKIKWEIVEDIIDDKDGEAEMKVWMTLRKNGQCELSVRRDGINKIVIASQTPLTDTQAEELFWCVGAMQRSGKTLKDLLKEQETGTEWLKKPTAGDNCIPLRW